MGKGTQSKMKGNGFVSTTTIGAGSKADRASEQAYIQLDGLHSLLESYI